jgi:ribosomal protein L29
MGQLENLRELSIAQLDQKIKNKKIKLLLLCLGYSI